MKKEILEQLTEKYGPFMLIKELAAVLRITPGAIRNNIQAGVFPIPTWLEGGRRLASTQTVAEYLSYQQSMAEKEHQKLQETLNA